MIVKLNVHDKFEVRDMLNMQISAYKVEAEIIGYNGIPQLDDTVESLMASKETFNGYKYDGKLAGFISYELSGRELDICRLVVHPNYFRKGIASRLLDNVMIENGKVDRFNVSTGSKNVPAIKLYERFGFTFYREVEVATGIFITLLIKKPSPNI